MPVDPGGSPPIVDVGAQPFSRPELGNPLRVDMHFLAGAGIVSRSGTALGRGEDAEVAQFDPIAVDQGFGDLAEDRRDDLLHLGPP